MCPRRLFCGPSTLYSRGPTVVNSAQLEGLIMSRGYCCSWLILWKSHNLVPLAIHRMLLYSYEKGIKQILSGNTNHDNFFVIFFASIALKLEKLGQIFSSFNPCPSLLTLGTRGVFSRATESFVSSAGSRHVFVRRPKTRGAGHFIRLDRNRKTAHEKPLAPRVILAIRSNRRQETVSMPKYNL